MDGEPDTLRPCEACGGTPEDPDACLWCTGGFQDVEQQVRWRKFRRKMRKISGTYDFLRGTVEDLVARLRAAGGDECLELAMEGSRLLQEWEVTDPVNGRKDVASDLTRFAKRAVDCLTK